MIKLKFLQNFAPYKAGEVAGFRNEADAERYLKAKREKKAVAQVVGEAKKSMDKAPVDKMVKEAKAKK